MVSVVRHSLRRKLTLVVMVTTLVALLLAATVMLVHDVRNYRQAWVDDLMTQANILALTGAPALAFNDPKAARENLAALRVRPRVLSAAMYARDGALFAAYTREGGKTPPPRLQAAGESVTISGGELQLTYPVEQNGEHLGTIYLRDRNPVREEVLDYFGILMLATLAGLLLAAVLSARLVAAITGPILAVADLARRVMDRRDFSLRATKASDDEIGALVDAVNGMLVEVDRHAAALETADRRKDEFLATLAHELRNPLAPIRTSLEILRLNPDPAKVLKAREILERQVKQMTRLVDDLLDVSRITTGKLIVTKSAIVLQEVLRDAVETVTPLSQARGQSLRTEIPPEPIRIDGDATRLAQVFANLLNNAVKYTPDGGKIDLAVQPPSGGAAVVEITDNGQGISAETLPHIFEMFTQADDLAGHIQSGLGVGLALSKRLIEMHGGSIEAASAGKGHGSRFRVRLPTLIGPQ